MPIYLIAIADIYAMYIFFILSHHGIAFGCWNTFFFHKGNMDNPKRSYKGSRRIRAWYQPNNECSSIPNAHCSVTTKWRNIDG